jgi:hypothetical protein
VRSSPLPRMERSLRRPPVRPARGARQRIDLPVVEQSPAGMRSGLPEVVASSGRGLAASSSTSALLVQLHRTTPDGLARVPVRGSRGHPEAVDNTLRKVRKKQLAYSLKPLHESADPLPDPEPRSGIAIRTTA